MKRSCPGRSDNGTPCRRSARDGFATCTRHDPAYVAPVRKPRAAKLLADIAADPTSLDEFAAERRHAVIERALDEQSEAVLDANSDADLMDAIASDDSDWSRDHGVTRSALTGEECGPYALPIESAVDAFVATMAGNLSRAYGPAEPVAHRDLKPSKPKKAKPAPESLLPGLEGYAKRDVSLGQWDSHPTLATAFVRWCGIERGQRVLEPSAGIGNIARALSDAGAFVISYEIDADRAQVLRERGIGYVQTANFLNVTCGAELYHAVAMNPPYENDGETTHMLHALAFAPRVCAIVRLVALASASRADAWRSVEVTRVAVLVPRPVFAGSSGMDEIAFVEIVKRRVTIAPNVSAPLLEWLDWRTA